jgi:hypothetical protein
MLPRGQVYTYRGAGNDSFQVGQRGESLRSADNYVFFPNKVVADYRRHLAEIKAGAKARP